VVSAAKRVGIALKQTFAKEGKELRRRAGGYAHAKQLRRLKRVVKRQRTILGIVMREVQRKIEAPEFAPDHPKAASDLVMWLERAERIRTQQRNNKSKLYALHAPEVECLAKGKARKPCSIHAQGHRILHQLVRKDRRGDQHGRSAGGKIASDDDEAGMVGLDT